jgi:hypothetical protein
MSEAGSSRTVQPAARAGPILRVAIAAGKFHGGDEEGDDDRLREHDDSVGARRRHLHDSREPHRLLRVPPEELRGVAHLAEGVGERFAILQHDQLGEPLFAGAHQHEGPPQDLAAMARRWLCPRRLCLTGCGDRGHRVGDRAVGHCPPMKRSVGGSFMPTVSVREVIATPSESSR